MGGTVRTVVNSANYLSTHGYDVEIISVRKTNAKPLFSIHHNIKITPLFDARRGKTYYQGMPFYKKLAKRILLKVPSFIIDRTEDLYRMFSLFTDIKIIRKIKSIKEGVLVTTIPSFNIIATKYANPNVIIIGQEHKYFDGHGKNLQKKIKKHYPKLHALTLLTDSEIEVYKQVLGAEGGVKLYKLENATEIPIESSSLDNKVVIAAGRFVEQKGFDLLIQAFSQVIKKHPDWKLKIFGSGRLEGFLRQQIVSLEAYNNIYLMPQTDNILNEMLKSSIYVLSSRYEPFGMVIIEAMSVGVPCVSFACSGPREIIQHNVDGILVDEGDINGLAESINKVIEDVEFRKYLGRNAKINAQKYSLERVGKKWEELLMGLSQTKQVL